MHIVWRLRGTEKSATNQRVHGISFETGKQVFDDPNHVAADNYFIASGGEQRYEVIGMTRDLVLLLIVFVGGGQPDAEFVHLFSARNAVDYEERIYKTSSGVPLKISEETREAYL